MGLVYVILRVFIELGSLPIKIEYSMAALLKVPKILHDLQTFGSMLILIQILN